MNDRASMLCQECDNVFHKSTAKKSHIRIPVHSSGTGSARSPLTPSSSRDKLSNVSRGNSSSLDPEEAHGQPVASTELLLRELNEYCKAPLLKYRLMDPGSGSGGRLLAPRPVAGNELALAVAFECVQCVVVAGLRGILDDREVRASA